MKRIINALKKVVGIESVVSDKEVETHGNKSLTPDLSEIRLDTYRKIAKHENSPEQVRLLAILKRDYDYMMDVLVHKNFSTMGVPNWNKIQKCLDTEVLEMAALLERPTILLVPPMSREAIIKQLKKNQVEFKNFELDNDQLWSGGKPEKTDNWRVLLMEGVEDVSSNDEVRGNNFEKCQALVNMCRREGFETMNDLRTFLMFALRTRFLPSQDTFDVLNAGNLKEDGQIAAAKCFLRLLKGHEIILDVADATEHDVNLRVRPVLELKVD